MDSATGDAGPGSKPVKRRRPDRAGKPLSEKELEILYWAKRGKTVWEISVIRSISQATVKFHLGKMYAKLEVRKGAQAVGEAGKRGRLR